MNSTKRVVCLRMALALMLVLSGAPAFAQVDLSGTWANRLHEDWVERAPGPHIGDYTGLPINDEARAMADAYQVSMQNMPERQCILYTSQYIVMGPQNLRIEQELDPISGARGRAGSMSGTVDRPPHTIWMDGRPHPSTNAPHTPGGFTTGEWEGTMLIATHDAPEDRAGVAQRRAAQRPGHDDRALRPARQHADGDDDPRPTRSTGRSRSSAAPRSSSTPTRACCPSRASRRWRFRAPPGEVPHYLPGLNPFLNEVSRVFNIPDEAARGGAASMYPEYQEAARG